ncbi:YlxR family protein [Cellulomonas wangsupingiae]|uniref:YlxR family protein n=1 Tax=Cellulomonas wangsupingiae TaxID=2968085 RepID=UPI003555F731
MGCRATGSRQALLRVVLDAGTGDPVLVVDEHRRMPGRGAWLHPDQRCLELAVKRRALGRALRYAGPLGTDTVARAVTRHAAQDPATAQHHGAGFHSGADRRQGSGLEADGPPMSTHR